VVVANGNLYGGSGNDQNLSLTVLGTGTLTEGSGDHQTATVGAAFGGVTAIGGSGSGDVLNAISRHVSLVGGAGDHRTYNLSTESCGVGMGSGNNDVANVCTWA